MRLITTLVFAAGALAGCGAGSGSVDELLYARNLQWQTSQGNTTLRLAPGESAELTVSICPAIIVTNIPAGPEGSGQENVVAYRAGRYQLSVEQLPPGVQAVFTTGAAPEIPAPKTTGLGVGPDGRWLPDPTVFSNERYCFDVPVRLQRDASPGTGSPAPVVVRLEPPVEISQTRAVIVQRVDGAAGPPPVAGAGCSADAALAGDWADFGTGAPLPVEPQAGLAAALLDDRPVVASLRESDVETYRPYVSAWSGTGWQRLGTDGDPAVRGSPGHLQLVDAGGSLWLAWLALDFSRPTASAARIVVWRWSGTEWQAQPEAAVGAPSDFRSGFRLHRLGAAVLVTWSGPGGLLLRRFDAGVWADLPGVDAPGADFATAIDSLDGRLVAVGAAPDPADIGRLAVQGFVLDPAAAAPAWLPLASAQVPRSATAAIAERQLLAHGGALSYAWVQTVPVARPDGSTALRALRLSPGASAWEADPALGALADAGRSFAVVPGNLQALRACNGSPLLAWVENAAYPDALVWATQARQPAGAAAPAWSMLGSGTVVGTATAGSEVRLLLPADGRPLVVVFRARSANAAQATISVRRLAPP